VIISGGYRNPAKPDPGTDTRAGRRRINPACLLALTVDATVPCHQLLGGMINEYRRCLAQLGETPAHRPCIEFWHDTSAWGHTVYEVIGFDWCSRWLTGVRLVITTGDDIWRTYGNW
jgi:hypothetical protein